MGVLQSCTQGPTRASSSSEVCDVRRPWEEFIVTEDGFKAPGETDLIGKGKGGFGFSFTLVYKAKLEGTVTVVDAKQLKWIKGLQRHSAGYLEKMYEPGNTLDILQGEICTRARLQHKNIVRFLGVTAQLKGNVRIPDYILLEHVSGGTLSGKSLNPQDPEAMRQLEGIAGALNYLHAQRPPVLHRDITPQNVLVTSLGEVKLADLGWAIPIPHAADPDVADNIDTIDNVDNIDTAEVTGTRWYTAPEVWSKRDQHTSGKHTVKSDMFSFGVTALVLLGLNPDVGASTADFEEKARAIAAQHCMLGLGAELFACLNKDPAKRPTAGSIAEVLHEYNQLLEDLPKAKARLKSVVTDIEDPKKLEVDGEACNEETTRALAVVLKEKRALQRLCLRDCRLSKAHFPELVTALRELKGLHVLALTDLKIGQVVQAVQHLPTLTELELQGNDLGEDVVWTLAESLQPLRELRLLDLCLNSIEQVATVRRVIRNLPDCCGLKLTGNRAALANFFEIEKEWEPRARDDLEL